MELDLAQTATRKMTAGTSPPAKRWQRATSDPTEQALRETLDDHATKIDQQHQTLKQMVATSAAGFQKVEERDAELREKLRILETQVVTNEQRLGKTESDVVSSDTALKENLKLMEAQLRSTAEMAKAAA